MKLLRNLTKFEKIYTVLFIASLVAGTINGVLNRQYFTCCEDAIGVPPEGTSVLKIFSNNFLISLTELVTAGATSLYYNFHTFSIASSYLLSQNAFYMIVIILAMGSFELVGSVLMALIGVTFIEQKVFKIKSKLRYSTLFFAGTALIFVGAVIEYTLLRPIT